MDVPRLVAQPSRNRVDCSRRVDVEVNNRRFTTACGTM